MSDLAKEMLEVLISVRADFDRRRSMYGEATVGFSSDVQAAVTSVILKAKEQVNELA